jgi:hypothetical protein
VSVKPVLMPASATYDPLTLTMTWKASAKDAPAARFRVLVTETQRATGLTRAFTHDFAIAVDPRGRAQVLPPPLGDAVELLITIHDADRLAEVNRAWPITKVFEVVRKLERAKQPAEKTPVDKRDGAAMLADAHALIALRHQNPRADQKNPAFDKRFAAQNWKIITVRPRLDKKVQELRIVYENVALPEPMYLMFRFRLAPDIPDLTTEMVAKNNEAFTRLTFERFFSGDSLNPRFVKDKRAHGQAVAGYVSAILEHPQAVFVALPHEARFGAGSARIAASGAYASGDGWGWAVFKAKWGDEGVEMISVPIPGFTTAVAPSADGTAWATVCAPKFDPADPNHKPGWEVLCRKKLGFTDLPQVGPDGKVSGSPVDAANLFVEHKLGDMVATVALDDPRRENFEENGMTCSQCHVRDFTVGDRRDPSVKDPRTGKLPAASAKIPTTMFNIVPEETWRPFTVEFQRFQECAFKTAFQKIGVQTTLTCPLVAE